MDQENSNIPNNKFVFHWGYAIFLFFIFYVLYLVFLVFKSRTIDQSLVMDNYYKHDLEYQAHYDKITNRKLLGQDLVVEQDSKQGNLILQFGEVKSLKSLKIEFYRPSDAALDFSKEFSDISTPVQLSTRGLSQGKWIIKVHWSDDKLQYFKEKELFISKT